MALSPLQAWRISTYALRAPTATMGNVRLETNDSVSFGRGGQRRDRARGINLYISVAIGQLDNIAVSAHITVLNGTARAPQLIHWRPPDLRQLFQSAHESRIRGQPCAACAGNWELQLGREDGLPWRALLPIHGELAAVLEDLRNELKIATRIREEDLEPFYPHLSLHWIEELPEAPDPLFLTRQVPY